MNTTGKLKKRIKELEELLKAKDSHIRALYEIIDAHGIPRDAVDGLRTVWMFEPAKGFRTDAPRVCGNCKYWLAYGEGNLDDGEIKVREIEKRCFVSGRRKDAGQPCNQLKSVSSDTEAAKCQKKAR